MNTHFFALLRGGTAVAAAVLAAGLAQAEPQHGIAMYGDPALPPDFVSLPYVNPDAPKGGQITFGEAGGFDSLNPHIVKGRAPYGVGIYVFESLMGRSWDEPFTLYGLLAESVETGPNREWVEFTLREDATFSDGSPVTVEDVIWSYETLGTEGHPRYRGAWDKVETAEKTGPRTVRFTFNTADRELPLILGLRPILKKAQWEGREFDDSGIDIVPIGSGPYVIGDFEPGRFIELDRDTDYWGADVPIMRGQHNFDQIRYDYFGDGDVVFEAFKAGEIDAYREGNAAAWANQYDFPRVRSGEVIKAEIPHERPTGMSGFVMNTRNPAFEDWRVREAMMHAFNFEFMNETLNGGEEPRITSYFSNSVLGMEDGPAEGRVRDLLEPYEAELFPGALEGYELPASDGTERNRRNIRRAMQLMAEAGWTIENGRMVNEDGEPFTFEILLSQGATETQQMIDIFASALERMGIAPQITVVDSAQYKERTTDFDFDMAFYRRGLSLSPGNEQMLYWSAEAAETPGSRNWMGMKSEAAEAMIDEMLTAETQENFVAAVKALDRVLTTGRYVIPIWHSPVSRLAHSADVTYPDKVAMYGDWIGFLPDVWWQTE
ncbi:extracellular solute-binding protein [Tranquillimonas alkanivorans]|uniref:Peptide/nickel transport system substrate-binding protein n=1 Tax=Tranquillimonas alkanivorans TaxID=441119 RepID=A0A1I5WNC4_9RHOB|nr:extracellular solute-binding protein [Tranquillimonas alkanivorans]SFQ20886.1 peptide/nickel transport system substrate-binding protein [Tranquillimonas alkanivorans]